MQRHLLTILISEPLMHEYHNLYLDQMLRLDVALSLLNDGHNVIRASEIGQSRADIFIIYT